MLPALSDGDRLLVDHLGAPDVGDLVVAVFPDGTLSVKRAAERRATRTGAPGWWLLSDNAAEGVDSRHRGVIADTDVRAVVRRRVWPLLRRD